MELLRTRAHLLRVTRSFLEERGSIEVETPALVYSPGVDANLDAIRAGDHWLATSPEYHMKRLLAAGSGRIHQIGKAWRAGETGRHHEPEFTLLEWYCPDFDDSDLMNETEELVKSIAGHLGLSPPWLGDSFARISWHEAFQQVLGFDPHSDPHRRLGLLLRSSGNKPPRDATHEDLEDLAFSLLVQPRFVTPTFVTDWPVERAALARLNADGKTAARFELYLNGYEICNGYHELTCPAEQRARIQSENQRRTALGKSPYPVDEDFIAALEAGLPDCAGNALGVDRLLMALLGLDDIGEVRTFRISQ